MKTKRIRPLRKHLDRRHKRRHAPARRGHAASLNPAPMVVSRPSGGRGMACLNLNGPALALTSANDGTTACLSISIDVPGPPALAYELWGRCGLPYFMQEPAAPANVDGARMTWCVRTLFDQFAWQAETCDVAPSDHITWRSAPGAPRPNFGSARFGPAPGNRTRVTIHLGFDMAGIYHWLGSPLPSIITSFERSLRRFHALLTASAHAQEPLPPIAE